MHDATTLQHKGNFGFYLFDESNGICIRVTDMEILRARDELGSNGVFVEPSGAVSFAGARKTGDLLDRKTVVCIATGHGLKDMYGIE